MKQVVKLGICVAILLVLFACTSSITIRANTKAPILPDDAVPNLKVKQPVSLMNVSSHSGELTLLELRGLKVVADFYELTETSIGAAKNVLERQGIEGKSGAFKVLELSVHKVNVEQGRGGWGFRVSTALRVRTGDGLEEEYVGVERFQTAYRFSKATENAIAQCVEQMLNDHDIIGYLEN